MTHTPYFFNFPPLGVSQVQSLCTTFENVINDKMIKRRVNILTQRSQSVIYIDVNDVSVQDDMWFIETSIVEHECSTVNVDENVHFLLWIQIGCINVYIQTIFIT